MQATPPLSQPQLASYLQRINLQQPIHADLAAFRAIVLAHSYAIPFENLSLVYPEPIIPSGQSVISTAIDDICEKLLTGRRGGYCFETNKLLSAALRALGFDVYDGAARVVKGPTTPPSGHSTPIKTTGRSSHIQTSAPCPESSNLPHKESNSAGNVVEIATPTVSPKEAGAPQPGVDDRMEPDERLVMHGLSHMVSLVSLDGQLWLADVGFGGSAATQPLLVEEGLSTMGPGVTDTAQARRHRLRRGVPGSTRIPVEGCMQDMRRGGWYLQIICEPKTEWVDLYFFTLTEFYEADFDTFNWRISTHPGIFLSQLMCTMPQPWGRATMTNGEQGEVILKLKYGGEAPQCRVLRSDAERAAALKEHFGIVMS